MEKVISAIQQLIQWISIDSNSPLFWTKKVFFGDPIKIPESDLPAVTIQPISTNYTKRGSRYDMKEHNIQIRVVYNANTYMGSNLWAKITVDSASRASWETTFNAVWHGLSVWSTVQIDWTNQSFVWSFKVTQIVNANSFKVAMINNPWAYAWGCTIQSSDETKVFAIQDAIRKTEWLWNNHETSGLSICWVIQKNPYLPLTTWWQTVNTSENSSVTSVDYTFWTQRWFPTFETVVNVDVTLIGDR